MIINQSRIRWTKYQQTIRTTNRHVRKPPEIVGFFEPLLEKWVSDKIFTFKEIKEICQNEELQNKFKLNVPKRSSPGKKIITADVGLFLEINFQLVHCPVLIEGQKSIVKIDNEKYCSVKISVFIDGKWKDLRLDLYNLARSLYPYNPNTSLKNYEKRFLWKIGKEYKAESWLRSIFWIPDEKRMIVKTADEVVSEAVNWRLEKYYINAPPEKAPKNQEEEIALTRKIFGMRPLPRRR